MDAKMEARIGDPMRPKHERRRRSLLSTLLAALLWCGCASPAADDPEIETAPHAQVTIDGLSRVKDSSYKYVWVKPDADFASYQGIIFGAVEVHYKRKTRGTRYSSTSTNFALTKHQTDNLKRALRDAFIAELTRDEFYRLVDEPGPDVMLIEVSIIDLIVKVPTQGSNITQQTFASSTAEMTLLMELRDSLSGEILARVADRQDANAPGFAMSNDLYYSNKVRDRSAVERVFKGWSKILRTRLDHVRSIEPTEKLGGGAAN